MDNVAGREGALDLKQWWTTAPQLDEHALRDGVLALLDKIYEASVYDEWDRMQEYIKLYELGEQYCTEEPHLSQYEFGKMGIWGYIADHYITLGDYQTAIKELEKVDELHKARLARYELLNLPPRFASEIRSHLLLALAQIKWRGAEEWRDALMTPDMILDEVERVSSRVLEFLKNNRQAPTTERNFREALALTELACCKLALRYCPSRIRESVDRFNRHHGHHLVLPAGHYKNVDAASGEHSAYYWDFELAKLRMTPEPTKDDIYMLIELRAMAAYDTFGDWPIQGLLRSWRREAMLIIRELKLHSA